MWCERASLFSPTLRRHYDILDAPTLTEFIKRLVNIRIKKEKEAALASQRKPARLETLVGKI